MTAFNAPIDYTNHLIDTDKKLDLIDFFSEVVGLFYPEQDVVSLRYFLTMTYNKNEFFIGNNRLIQYDIVQKKDTEDISIMQNKLKDFGLIFNRDYKLILPSSRSTVEQYFLTPYAFKKCLIKINNHEFAEYLLILEEVVALYRLYQDSYHKKYDSNDYDTNLKLILCKINDQSSKLNTVLHIANTTKESVFDMTEQMDNLKGEIQHVSSNSSLIAKTIATSVMTNALMNMYNKQDESGNEEDNDTMPPLEEYQEPTHDTNNSRRVFSSLIELAEHYTSNQQMQQDRSLVSDDDYTDDDSSSDYEPEE